MRKEWGKRPERVRKESGKNDKRARKNLEQLNDIYSGKSNKLVRKGSGISEKKIRKIAQKGLEIVRKESEYSSKRFF